MTREELVSSDKALTRPSERCQEQSLGMCTAEHYADSSVPDMSSTLPCMSTEA